MVSFRLAQSQDLEVIFKIEQAAQKHPWSKESFVSSFHAQDQIFLIIQNNQIAGFIIFRICLDEAEILNFAIHPDFQRQGLGKQLLAFGIHEMQVQNRQKVFLEVRCSNQAAISLYQSSGFKQFSIRKEYYKNGSVREDALLFCLVF